jgi:hypothetical protein
MQSRQALDTLVVSVAVPGITGLRIPGKTEVGSGGGRPICMLENLAQVEIPLIVTRTEVIRATAAVECRWAVPPRVCYDSQAAQGGRFT